MEPSTSCKVGVTSTRQAFAETFETLANDLVIYYPYFIAQKSGTLQDYSRTAIGRR